MLKSYLLIGFWHFKESANKAAIKAFVVNRIGDFGFALVIVGVVDNDAPKFSYKAVNAFIVKLILTS